MNDPETIDEILDEMQVWAVVGLSANPDRPSHGVAQKLQSVGKTVIPVNPREEAILGERSYADVDSIPHPIDVVDIFRRPEQAGAHVDEAIRNGAKAVWMQLGVIDEDAAARAEAAGLHVVMDRCPAIELRRRGR
jgi:predicted CoA-binding protein